MFESAGIAPDVLTQCIGCRSDEPHRHYEHDRYDVYWEGFDSLDTLRASYPELRL